MNQSRRILIVHDDEGSARIIQQSLVKQGFESCDITADMEVVLASQPDLLLVLCPVASWLDRIEIFSSANTRIPFVLLAWTIDGEVIELAKSTGADGLLKLPVDDTQLLAAIEMALTRSLAETQRDKKDAALKELIQNQAYFKTLFDRSPVPYLIIGLSGLILQVSASCFNFLGFTPDELVGQRFSQHFHPDELANSTEMFVKLTSGGIKELSVERRLIHKAGHIVYGRVTITPIYIDDPIPQYLLATCEDITAQRVAEDALRKSEERLRMILDTLPGVVYVYSVDATGGEHLSNVSAGVIDLIGLRPQQIIEDPGIFRRHIDPEDIPVLVQSVQTALQTGQSWTAEYRYRMADGSVKWLRGSSVPVEDPSIHQLVHVGVALDITPLKVAEEHLRLAVKGKDALLHEVHHRIKNNLQVIISLLSMQASSIKDPAIRVIFEESRDRISAISLVHQSLYQSSNVNHLEFSTFIAHLGSGLLQSYGMSDRVELVTEVQTINLDVDRGIVCGLITNELISNALKYAFPVGRTGKVVVRCWQVDQDIWLSVCDDGVGLPSDFDLETSQSMGLHLVKILSEQLYGTLSVDSTCGTCFQIQFQCE